MKKLLLLLVSVISVTLLMAPMAYASPVISPTETRPPVESTPPEESWHPVESTPPEESWPPVESTPPEESRPPVEQLEEPDVDIEIPDEELPLSEMPSPQTGVTGLSGMETVSLMAMALAASGALVLAKARKQTGSVR